MNSDLELQFHDEMLNIYEVGKRLHPPYHATRFRKMVLELGGKRAADELLATGEPSEGFTELYLRGNRLDLSVEYLVLKDPWRTLFDPDQLAIARERLRKYNFAPPAEGSS
jgi:hypothetical protein